MLPGRLDDADSAGVRSRPAAPLHRATSGLTNAPLFWRPVLVLFALSSTVGGVWGFVRGLSYLPTLPAAIVEGAILVGVPGTLVGGLVASVVVLIARIGD